MFRKFKCSISNSISYSRIVYSFNWGLISAPVLKLKGDYLAIATGFSEIIRILFTNMTSITNGAKEG